MCGTTSKESPRQVPFVSENCPVILTVLDAPVSHIESTMSLLIVVVLAVLVTLHVVNMRLLGVRSWSVSMNELVCYCCSTIYFDANGERCRGAEGHEPSAEYFECKTRTCRRWDYKAADCGALNYTSLYCRRYKSGRCVRVGIATQVMSLCLM